MVYSTAKEVYQKLNAVTKGDEDAEMLYRDLVKLAVDYARRRTDWQLSDVETRIEMDEARTMVHDAFIGSCNSLSRYLERVGREYHGIIRDTLRKNADWSDVFESGILSQRASVDIYVNPESIIALIPYEYSEEKSLLFVERGPLAEWVEDDEAYVFDVSVIDPLMRIVIDSLLKASKEAGLDNYYPVVIVGLRNLWNGGMLVASLTYKPVGVDSLLGGKYTHTRWAYTYDPEFLITVPQGSYTIKRGVQWFEGKRLFTSKEVKRDTYSTVQPLLWFLDLNEADIPTLKSLPNFLKP